MTSLLEARSLTKKFGSITAVNGVSFAINKGEVMGFLGPNGAGKSTTMKMLTGFLRPTAGDAFIAGLNVEAEPIAAKQRLGYLPEGAPAYGDMTPYGFLKFAAAARGLPRSAVDGLIDKAIARTHLKAVLHRPVETLSKGFKRRVGLAQAILHDPDVLVLDEPTDGLDPNQKQEMRKLINAMAADKAIIISTHILEEVEAVCSRAIVIDRGRVVADGTPLSLRSRSRYHNAVTLTLASADRLSVQKVLSSLAGVAAVEVVDGLQGLLLVTAVSVGGKPILDMVTSAATAQGWTIKEIAVDPGRLDDVFWTLTSAEAGTREEGAAA